MKSCFVMTVAGSDSSGGAGVQADLKTFCRMGVYGLSAVTCVVAENAKYVGRIFEVDPDVVSEQIKLCNEAFEIGAVKTGMLPNAKIIETVAGLFSSWKMKPVVDPVMVASTGAPLVSSEAIVLIKKILLPRCLLMMPNLDEAAVLLNRDTVKTSDFEDCASQLSDIYQCSVFLKGGHLQGNVARDILLHPNGKEIYEAEKITGVNTHGTGCTLSAAVTAALALGQDLPTACATAKHFVTQAIKDSVQTKVGKLLNHNTTHHSRMRSS